MIIDEELNAKIMVTRLSGHKDKKTKSNLRKAYDIFSLELGFLNVMYDLPAGTCSNNFFSLMWYEIMWCNN